MKTNVIPDSIDLDVDIRTLPGEAPTTCPPTCGRRSATSPTMSRSSPDRRPGVDQPHGDAAVGRPAAGGVGAVPGARLTPQFIVGFTDARVFRELGAVAYGAGLFSPTLDPAEYGRRFHGNDERIDVESLRLTIELWQRVLQVSDGHTPTSIGSPGRRPRAARRQLGQAAGAKRTLRRQRRARRESTTAARAPTRRGVVPTSASAAGSNAAVLDQVDAVVLAVPATVDERDDVQAVPDVRADVDVGEAELLVQLAAQRRLVVLARLLTATGRRPHGHVRELEAHEQHAARRVEHEGAHGRTDPQAVDVHLFSRFVGQVVVEGAVHLVDRLALLAQRECFGSRVGTHTWPHSASSGVP